MDAMIVEAPLLLSSPTAETAPRVAAGRLPLMAFVDAETERVLQESSGMLGRCAIMRGGIGTAIKYLSEQRSPQLLLVDISSVDLPLSKLQILADVCEPGTTVVALGDRNDVGLYRDLLEIGVSNYLVKPVTRELLGRVLSPRAAPSDAAKAALKLGKIVAFVSDIVDHAHERVERGEAVTLGARQEEERIVEVTVRCAGDGVAFGVRGGDAPAELRIRSRGGAG